MARGWESKAVESQIETAESRAATKQAYQAPEELAKLQLRQSLTLSRNRVLADLQQSRNPRYQKMLNDALAHLDAKLAELE